MFEHGANSAGSLTGCGVDHAHFHIVPYKKSLIPAIEDSNMTWHNYCQDDQHRLTSENDYLFYSDQISESNIGGIFTLPVQPVSQFFRKILANNLGLLQYSDYKKHPYIESSRRSHHKLNMSI